MTPKQPNTNFTLRISTDLLNAVKKEAELNKRSVCKQIEFILEKEIKENKKNA